MFYQVRTVLKDPPEKEINALNLVWDELENRVLMPYRQNLPITLSGTTFQPVDIANIRIMETDRRVTREDLLSLPTLTSLTSLPSMHLYNDTERNVTNSLITGPPGYATSEIMPISTNIRENITMRIFISHSNNDVEVAKLLIDLLRKALNLKSSDIRCTSVDGYRMTGGASVDDTLRAEVHDAKLLIGLITPTSLKSAYVMFELGARWGAEKPMIPLLASGATPGHLGGPLAGINALDASQTGQLHQLLGDVARHLSITLDQPSSYTDAIEELVKVASIPSILEQPLVNDGTAHLSEDAKELLLEAEQDASKFIRVRPIGNNTFIRTNGRHFVEKGDLRSAARWKAIIQEIQKLGLVECSSIGKGTNCKLTHKGFQLVDKLRKEA